jgi:hypothetical protein
MAGLKILYKSVNLLTVTICHIVSRAVKLLKASQTYSINNAVDLTTSRAANIFRVSQETVWHSLQDFTIQF